MTTETHTHTSRCWWNPDHARWVCSAGIVALPEPPAVDVRDMLVVHTAMLREFRLAPAAVRRVDPADARQVARVDRHLEFLCDLLRHHHEGEDDLLWPLMRERVPAGAVDLLDVMEGQHGGIDASLQAVAAARVAWRRDASDTGRDTLAAGLETLYALLKAHLDLEESTVLPLAAGVLTESEWHAIGEAAVAAMPKPALVLAFGMFAYEGDPSVLRSMLALAPAVPRVVVPRIAPGVYARHARRVHGTRRP